MDTNKQLKYWLALLRAPELGAVMFTKLLRAIPDLSSLFATKQQALESIGLPEPICAYINNPDWQGVERDLQWEQDKNHHILTLYDSHYPPLLKETICPPALLFVHGNPEVLSSPQLAIVGSRHATPVGLHAAQEFAQSFVPCGLTITSGLALGIDAAAHQGALAANGKTIAVVGCGLNRVYPAKNVKLAAKISEIGAIVSEFPIGTPPLAKHFPQRNRIISGLSLGTLVIEAAQRSGSLITARYATEQGREVFAVPGSIHNPLARGCHTLIKQGAKLVETATDVLEELGQLAAATSTSTINESRKEHPQPQSTLDPQHKLLLNYMGYEPTTVDELVERSKSPAEQVTRSLLLLELQGQVHCVRGGYMKA